MPSKSHHNNQADFPLANSQIVTIPNVAENIGRPLRDLGC